MSMTFAERFLVVVLASALAVFLVLGIVALVKIIQILKDVKHITEKAEKIADQVEAVSEFFQNTAGPASIVKIVSNIVHNFTNKKQKGKNNGQK